MYLSPIVPPARQSKLLRRGGRPQLSAMLADSSSVITGVAAWRPDIGDQIPEVSAPVVSQCYASQ